MYFRQAAAFGDPIGIADYGLSLLNAMGVEIHQQNGLDYIQKYADVNYAESFYYLGFGSTRGDSQLRK
jgi:hypothetical protein